MPTTDELRERQRNVQNQGVQAVNDLMNAANGHPYAHIAWPHRPLHTGREAIETCQGLLDEAITELEARDREIQTWKDTVRDRTYELSQAKREIAELREEVKEYAFLFELEQKRTREATAAWRGATGKHNVSPDLGVLLEWLLGYREHAEKLAKTLEGMHEWFEIAMCAACGAVSMAYDEACGKDPYHDEAIVLCRAALAALAAYREHRKVSPEATITQEETHE